MTGQPFAAGHHWRGLLAIAFLLALVPQKPLHGQGAGLGVSLGVEPTGVSYPSPQYYAALEIYRTAELDAAVDAFEVAISRTRRDINGHWIDAIPVYAMMAEAQYRVGDLEGAMQSLDMVMKIAVRYRGWLRRPVWEELIRTEVVVSPRQFLWAEANAVSLLPTNRSMKFYSGEQLTEQRLAQGGQIEELNIKTVDVVEVLRGLAIASYRRRIILGPLAEGDALAGQVLESTKYPAGLQVAAARNLIGAMRAAERFGAYQDDRAVGDAGTTTLIGGRVHPLSPISGLCMASALVGTDKVNAVVPMCLGIANQAARLGHYEWIGEAMQLGAGCADEKQAVILAQASTVAATSLIRESRLAALHCLIAAADASVTAGDLNTAATRLGEARTLALRRDVIQPRLDAYGAYVAARMAARQRAISADTGPLAQPWDEPLTQMISFATNSKIRRRNLITMPRLYQLQRVRLALGRNLSGQSADLLLARYTDQPTIDVWRRDPVDALAGVMADREALRIARLRAAAARESALDVLMRVEDLQTGRMMQQLAIGGRVLQTRALSRMDDALLEKTAVGFRNAAAKPIRDLRAAASAVPPPDAAMADQKVLDLERQAWSIAFDRHDLPTVMPHPLDEKRPLEKLPPGVGILTFCEDGNLIHVTLCAREKSSYWTVKGASRVSGEIAKLMRGIGAARTRGPRLPEDDSWREDAIALRDRLIESGTGDLTQERFAGLERLIVIPDSLLWYVPFELLPVGEADSKLLGEKISITYAATPSLALYATNLPDKNPVAGLTAGKFFAPLEVETNEAIVESILASVDAGNVLRLPDDSSKATSQLGGTVGHLLVGEPTTPNPASPLDTSLAAYESSMRSGRLRSWMGFPGPKPVSVMLAGFRSHLDTSQAVSGREIFQTVAALQYGGVRDVILSRWAVGGQSTAIVMSEYLQEVPFLGSEAAFQRALTVLRRSELAPKGEPTMVGSDQDRETLTGEEPLFWSTYLHAAPL